MIRINLIYDSKAVQVVKVKQDAILALMLTISVMGGIVYIWGIQNEKVLLVQNKVRKTEARKNELSRIEKKINNHKKTKNKILKRTKAISSLLEKKKGPTRIFDRLNQLLSDEVWLSKLTQSGTKLKLSGISFSNPGIADFMENLKEDKYFHNVELKGIDQRKKSGEIVKNFSLEFDVKMPSKKKKGKDSKK